MVVSRTKSIICLSLLLALPAQRLSAIQEQKPEQQISAVKRFLHWCSKNRKVVGGASALAMLGGIMLLARGQKEPEELRTFQGQLYPTIKEARKVECRYEREREDIFEDVRRLKLCVQGNETNDELKVLCADAREKRTQRTNELFKIATKKSHEHDKVLEILKEQSQVLTEDTIRLEQEVARAVRSVTQAEQSVTQAEQSVTRVEQRVEQVEQEVHQLARRVTQFRVLEEQRAEYLLRVYHPYMPAASATASIVADELARTVQELNKQSGIREQQEAEKLLVDILIERFVHRDEDRYRQLMAEATDSVRQQVHAWAREATSVAMQDLKRKALERKSCEWIAQDITDMHAFNEEIKAYKLLLVAHETDEAFVEEIEQTIQQKLSFFCVDTNDGVQSRFLAQAVRILPYFNRLLESTMRESVARKVTLPGFSADDLEWVVKHALVCSNFRAQEAESGMSRSGRVTRMIQALEREMPIPPNRFWQCAELADYLGHADGLSHIARYYVESLEQGQNPFPGEELQTSEGTHDNALASVITGVDKEIRRQYFLVYGTWPDGIELPITDVQYDENRLVNRFGVTV